MVLDESCCPNSSEPLECKEAPPNCETCPKKADYSCKFGLADMTAGFTKHTGCFDHPLSRAWLNRDVIRELERRVGRLGTYPNNTQAIRAYTEAIALLKGEVGK